MQPDHQVRFAQQRRGHCRDDLLARWEPLILDRVLIRTQRTTRWSSDEESDPIPIRAGPIDVRIVYILLLSINKPIHVPRELFRKLIQKPMPAIREDLRPSFWKLLLQHKCMRDRYHEVVFPIVPRTPRFRFRSADRRSHPLSSPDS